MFLKACESAFAHTGLMTHTVKAGICFSSWSRNRWGNEKYNSFLLDFTNKDKTLKVLDHLQETADPAYNIDNTDLIVFDKLSESVNSESHRVFDLYYKKFFALKTVSLDSETGWKEVNLMLKQHFNEMNRLAPVRSFSYNKSEKQVKILSELEKTVVGEFAYFRKRQGLKWNSQELKAVLWHLLKIVRTLKSHETHVEYLKADDIFLDSKDGKLKAFDYPGAAIGHNFGFKAWGMHSWDQGSFDVAVHTLVKIADPHAPVDNPEEARAYLSINYPEFKNDFLEIELAAKGGRHFQSDLLPLEEIFENKDYGKYLSDKLKKTFDQKPGRSNEEEWALVNQGLRRFDEAESILKSLVHENINRFGITHPIVTKNYLNLAELYEVQEKDDLASKYYQNALNSSRSDAKHDKELLARLHLKYGKFLMMVEPENNKQFAMEEFEKAYGFLKEKNLSESRLLHEIEKSIENLKNENYDPHNGHYNSEGQGQERRKWKKRKIIKIIFYLWLLNWISKRWFKDDHHQNPQVEETNKSEPSKPVVTKIEPQINEQKQPALVVTVTSEKPAAKVNVEPVLPKIVPVVPPEELQQDSKFAWFLFGLNIAIGFAGLTLPSAN